MSKYTIAVITMCMMLHANMGLLAQVQVGRTIPGFEVQDDCFFAFPTSPMEIGTSVAISADGKHVVVGAPGKCRPHPNQGHDKDNTGATYFYWEENGNWTDSPTATFGYDWGDRQGHAVALSGNWLGNGPLLVTGEPTAQTIGASPEGNGSITISRLDTVGPGTIFEGNIFWRSIFYLGTPKEEGIGSSVAISDDGFWVAAGVPRNDEKGENAGSVEIIMYNDSLGRFMSTGKPLFGEVAAERFGWAIAMSKDGNRLAVGSPGYNGNGTESGRVQIFERSGSDWLKLGSDILGEFAGDKAGHSVALSGNGERLAVGIPGSDNYADSAGQVRVFNYRNDAWVQTGGIIDGEKSGDKDGWAVSLSDDGNMLASGAPKHDGRGRVRVFTLENLSWVQQGESLYGERDNTEFGYSVALAGNGERLVAGAPRNSSKGEVRIFDLTQISSPVDVSPTPIKIDLENVTIYPNPSRGTVTIASEGVEIERVEIVDPQGRRLKLKSNIFADRLEINMNYSGIAFFKIYTSEGVNFEKVIFE